MATTFLEPGTDETQDLTFWPNTDFGGSGTGASASDQTHTGSRSLKLVNPGGSSDSCFVSTDDNVLQDAGFCASAWVRLSAIPSTDMLVLSTYQAGFGSAPLALAVTSAGKLRLVRDDGAAYIGAAGATVLSATTWTRITIAAVITSGSNWTCKAYVNGVLELTRTNADATLTLTGVSEFSATVDRALAAGTRSALTVWYDDVYVDDRTDLTDCGDIRVTAKRPIANGTTNGFTTQIGAGGSGTGTGHSPQVNEQPLSQTNGWSMIGAGSAITEEYNVESVSAGDIDLTGQTIVDWMGWVFAKSLVGETGKILVKNTQSNIALTSTPTLFIAPASSASYPAGSGTDIGIVTDTSLTTVSLYECGVIVAYTIGAAVAPYPPWPPSLNVLLRQ